MEKSGVIHEVVLVVGYLADQIEAKLSQFNSSLRISTVYNPFYSISNNLISLWMARSHMDIDFMVTNGDNLFCSDVFKNLKNDANFGVTLALSEKETFDGEDMKTVIQQGSVIKISKEIDTNKISGKLVESPGLTIIKGYKYVKLFRMHLETLVRKSENLQKYWLEVFNHMADGGIAIIPWVFNGSSQWQEVDFHMDMEKARQLFGVKIKR